jgi:hypothetical protein
VVVILGILGTPLMVFFSSIMFMIHHLELQI